MQYQKLKRLNHCKQVISILFSLQQINNKNYK